MNLDQICLLNTAYCRLTGNQQPMNWYAEMVWREWLRYTEPAPAWTVADLEVALAYVRRHMQPAPGQDWHFTQGSMRFDRLIQNPQRFLEILSDARHEFKARPKPETPRQEILRATGRPSSYFQENGSHTKTPAQVIAGDEALKNLLKLRDAL